MDEGVTPAARWAALTTSTCPRTPGAVKPARSLPSLFTAEPRSTAWMWSPSATASDSRFSTVIPHPWPPTTPSAAVSNGLQTPEGEVIPPTR